MDLDLEIKTRGRPARPVVLTVARELTQADISLLATDRQIKPIPIKRLRDSHHALARCLASGMKPAEASIVTGYCLARISILQSDPSFAELLNFYRSNEEMQFAEFQTRMSALGLDAIQELHDRLLEEPEKLSPGQLLELVKSMADRTGHGPATKSTNVNVNVDLSARLEAARRRVGEMLELRSLPAGSGAEESVA